MCWILGPFHTVDVVAAGGGSQPQRAQERDETASKGPGPLGWQALVW